MLPRTAVVTGLLAVLSFAGTGALQPRPASIAKEIEAFKKELPESREKLAALLAAPEPPSGTAPLPTPSLTEPFEIGEALYDEGRVADAVVSLLALMRIGVVSDANANTRAAGITLSESEVQALIDLAQEDLAASDNDMERLPYTFTDMHAAVAGLLPGVTVEALSETYTRAYQARPDDLVAKAMMGRPLDPETTLTRAQIWFLMMDGFAGAAAAGGRWGTADREVPDLKSPDAQWTADEFREVLARLPLVTASRLVTMNASDVIRQGTTAGPPVNVTARVAESAPPLVSRISGRTLLAARAGSLSGQEVTWHVHDESMLPDLGKIVTPVDDPQRVGPDGLARFVIQPGIDPTRGAGQLLDDWEPIEAGFQTRSLLASAYAVPASVADLSLGTTRARANVRLRWRSPDVLYLIVWNLYNKINFEIPGLGGGTRDGMDKLYAFVSKRGDDYWGRGLAEVNATQTLRGGSTCQKSSVAMSQRVRVKVESETAFPLGPTRVLDDYLWADTQLNPVGTWANPRPDGGYYRLLIFPATEPPFGRQCISIIPAGPDRLGWGAKWFIPLNDAQWTTSGQGFPMALKSKGLTAFFDTSSQDPLGMTPLAGVKQAFQLTGASTWMVLAARTFGEFPFPK